MPLDTAARRRLMSLSRGELRAQQLEKLNRLLACILPTNRFYADRFAGLPRTLSDLDQLSILPLMSKRDLASDEPSGLARHLTYPAERYTRYHRTSGTRGHAIGLMDTADDWEWWIETWQYVLDAAGVRADDRVVMAFSFGPFIGFWSAHDAVIARGALVIPTGGMNSLGRLEVIRAMQCTVLFCTPSYAMHLAAVARDHRLDLRSTDVRLLVVAGEPGGSIPSVRRQIEEAWGATVFDHCGATEIGPWGFADAEQRGLVVNEAEFIAEFLPVERPEAAPDDRELVLTTLGRWGAPVIRYRTGDLVRPASRDHHESCCWVLLVGGVLGRVDDMVLVRGVNIYPSAIDEIVREFLEFCEYRVVIRKNGALDQMTVEVEHPDARLEPIAERLNLRLGLKVGVQRVAAGTLPRSEFKSRRIVDLRSAPDADR
jgi:phenylacetate-CoA ligase